MTISSLSQCGQRATTPGVRRYTATSASGPARPHPAHVPTAVVISRPNTSNMVPAIALPSSLSIVLRSRPAEALGSYPVRLVTQRDQGIRCRLHERGRATHIDQWALVGRPTDLGEKVLIDPTSVPSPALRLLTGQRHRGLDAVSPDLCQLVPVDEERKGTSRAQQPHRHPALDGSMVTPHRTERHQAGSACNQEERTAQRLHPDEVATDRPTQLQLVAGAQ